MNELLLTFILLLNIVAAPFLVRALQKYGFYKKKELPKETKVNRNRKYYNHLLENMSTPSSFGLLLLINLLIFLFFPNLGSEVVIITIVAITLGLLGLFDDVYQFFYYQKVGQWGLKARYKLIIQILVFTLVFYLISKDLFSAILISFPAVFILNSFNITDGLDGLAGGIALPTLLTFLYFEYNNNGTSSLFFLILVLIIFVSIFLVFNIKPAKVFLGDSGSYAIGAVLSFLVLKSELILAIPLIAFFLIEGLSSLIQIVSIKLFNRKVFKIAPLHLHLLNSGWSQWQEIGTAWIIQIFISILIIIFSNARF